MTHAEPIRTYTFADMPKAWSRKAYDRAERVRRAGAVGFFSSSGAASCSPFKPSSGGGGLTTTPSYIAAGTGAEGNPIAADPTLPTNIAGDLFVAVGAGYLDGWTAPAGWTLQAGPNTTFGTQNNYFWTRDARSTGGESGSVVFTPTGRNIIRIFSFRNVATSAFIESIGTASGTSGTVTNPTVTPGGTKRLGVLAWMGFSTTTPSAAVAVGSAASGGTWAEVSEFDGTNDIFFIELQTADLSAGSAISGGTTTISGTNQAFCYGFALVGV